MPSAADISNSSTASFLLVGDSGTHKSFFIGTCPSPIYVFDFDDGMAIHAGRADIEYDTFKEAPRGVKVSSTSKLKLYEWGTAWPAFLKKINEVGASIDKGECKFKTLGFDSLTLLTDICQSFILKQNGRDLMQKQDWGAFLSNMSEVFSQLTSWPLVKVMVAHIRRMENDLTKVEEKLPLIPGQFSGKVSIYFDEVYYTEAKTTTGKTSWSLISQPTSIIRQAKSRRYNVPDGVPTSYESLKPYMVKK